MRGILLRLLAELATWCLAVAVSAWALGRRLTGVDKSERSR